MPPKKTKATSKPAAAPSNDPPKEAPITATETAEPPKDETQPAEGKLGEPAPAVSAYGESGDVREKSAAEEKGTEKATKEQKPASNKRKKGAETQAPKKDPRKGTRAPSGRNAKATPSQQQLLTYLLSKEAEEFVRPEDEKEDIKKSANLRTYTSSQLSPFEELMAAVILSRPISHKLGMRTIRTILNAPYGFSTPKALKDAGEAKILEAMDTARTQHRGKTANELVLLGDLILEKYTSADDKDGTQLKKVLAENDNDFNQALSSLRKEVKGLGANGESIFMRRTQWLPGWDDAYPYVDPKAEDALRKLELPRDREELQQLIKQHWSKLKTANIAGGDDATKQKRAFSVVLERSIVADLEQRIDEVLKAAAS